MITIDGAQKSGGDTIVRSAVALATLLEPTSADHQREAEAAPAWAASTTCDQGSRMCRAVRRTVKNVDVGSDTFDFSPDCGRRIRVGRRHHRFGNDVGARRPAGGVFGRCPCVRADHGRPV